MPQPSATDKAGGGSAGKVSRQIDGRRAVVGLARAFAGAIIFALSLLMTMEMWWLGFYMDRLRFAFFLLVMLHCLSAVVPCWPGAPTLPASSGTEPLQDAFVPSQCSA